MPQPTCPSPLRPRAASAAVVFAALSIGATPPAAPVHSCAAPGPATTATVRGGGVGSGSSRPWLDVAPLVDETEGVVLAGLVVPTGLDGADRADLARRLAALAGRTIRLRATADEPDRRRRLPALVEMEDGRSLQSELLEAGLAVYDGRASDCADAFLPREAVARTQKRGIWAAPTALVSDADGVAGRLPDFFVLKGRVVSVGHSGRTTYLNFGRDWRKDMTVRIGGREADALAALGRPLDALTGRIVEARGWVEAHDGPDLWLASAAALAIVEPAVNGNGSE